MDQTMDIQEAIRQLVGGRSLASKQMQDVVSIIMRGEATPAQIGALLVALRIKGETVAEITGAALTMRSFAVGVNVNSDKIVDTVGTGGDGARLFNVSTASSFVAAAAGAVVAKHGNRAATGKTGAADLLEAAGIRIGLPPEQVAACIKQIGIGFMFAPAHHGATRHAVGPRREIGVPSIFNLLGPLTNPAGAKRQLVGVFEKRWVKPLAEVLGQLGSTHAVVVHSAEGLDEISIAGETFSAELKNGKVTEQTLTPESLGVSQGSIDMLTVDSAKESLAIINRVFTGESGPASDIVKLNAGVTIYVAGLAGSMQAGVQKAAEVIANGKAAEKMRALATMTHSFPESA